MLFRSFSQPATTLPCEVNGFIRTYESQAENRVYYKYDTADYSYWEGIHGTSYADVRFEKRNSSGALVWRIEAQRACTQGISRCYLNIPFALDGELFSSIEAEMNHFEIGTQEFVLFSHLRAKIAYTYSRTYTSQKFSLVGEINQNLEEKDYEIPNLFQRACKS